MRGWAFTYACLNLWGKGRLLAESTRLSFGFVGGFDSREHENRTSTSLAQGVNRKFGMTVRFARDASPETHPTPKRTRSWFASMRVQRRLRCKGRARLPSANQERSTSDSTRTRSGRLSRALTERRFVAGRSRAFPSLLIRSKGIRPRLSPRRGSRAHDSTQSPSSHLESYAPRAARSSVPTPRRWPRLRVEPSPARAALAAERTTREGECLVSSSRLGTRALVLSALRASSRSS